MQKNLLDLSHFAALLLAAPKRGRRHERDAAPKDSFRKWCGLRRARLNTVVGETHAAKERRLGRAGARFLDRLLKAGTITPAELERRLEKAVAAGARIEVDGLEQASRGRA